MTYRIARNGEIYGPSSQMQVQRHLASGHVRATDLAQGETMDEWLPVAEIFPAPPSHEAPLPGGLPRLFPNPPNLRWWLALIFGVVTLGVFFVVWDVVEAAWLRRVERSNGALILYCLALLLFVVNLPAQIASISHALFNGPLVEAPFALWLSVGAFLARLFGRFVLRKGLLSHFNKTEPVGLALNWFLTLLFSGLYFQYHFNRINEIKRALKVSVPES